MKKIINLIIVCAALVATGCASVVNDSTHSVRFETYTQAGAEVKDMECKAENDYGVQTVKTPGTLQIRRSSKDLQINCTKPETKDAKGTAISRVNAGFAGNILFGGGIGAIIDHNKGTAYTYPEWVRLVVDSLLTFDRRADKEGAPNVGTATLVITPVAAK